MCNSKCNNATTQGGWRLPCSLWDMWNTQLHPRAGNPTEDGAIYPLPHTGAHRRLWLAGVAVTKDKQYTIHLKQRHSHFPLAPKLQMAFIIGIWISYLLIIALCLKKIKEQEHSLVGHAFTQFFNILSEFQHTMQNNTIQMLHINIRLE